jgi:hypothetical protein
MIQKIAARDEDKSHAPEHESKILAEKKPVFARWLSAPRPFTLPSVYLIVGHRCCRAALTSKTDNWHWDDNARFLK